MKHNWKPLQRAGLRGWVPPSEPIIQVAMRRTGATREETLDAIRQEMEACEYWVNDLNQVALRRMLSNDRRPDMIHLNIRRRDGKSIFRDWRHFQRIKNELVGEECEAVEIYPAESRLNDTSNKYHLWVFTDPNYRIPFGLEARDVVDDSGNRKARYRQRRL
jgi:hypothetical protein